MELKVRGIIVYPIDLINWSFGSQHKRSHKEGTIMSDEGRAGAADDSHERNDSFEKNRLAPFNPTCGQAQAKALDLLAITSDDVLFDLGCGDARLLIAAAQQIQRLRCVGIDMDPVFVAKAKRAVAAANLEQRIDIRQENLTETTNSSPCIAKSDTTSKLTLKDDATAIYMYLLPKGLARIQEVLLDDLVVTDDFESSRTCFETCSD